MKMHYQFVFHLHLILIIRMALNNQTNVRRYEWGKYRAKTYHLIQMVLLFIRRLPARHTWRTGNHRGDDSRNRFPPGICSAIPLTDCLPAERGPCWDRSSCGNGLWTQIGTLSALVVRGIFFCPTMGGPFLCRIFRRLSEMRWFISFFL